MSKKKAPARTKASTALAVRKKSPAPRILFLDPQGMLPQAPVGQLGELATVGALGLAEIKLTEAEEKVLSRPVDASQILMKPARRGEEPSIPYLPHIVYTRWFNDAFGRTGWSIVPTAAPKKVDNLVLVPYLLYIHGIPVAAATGEQEYIESNRQQTYGDVIESTVASALRRCAKRLGVGLEMWDEAWLDQNARPRGQRRSAPAQREEVIDAHPEPRQPVSSQLETPVTPAQLGQIAQTVERSGRPASEVTLWLKKRWGVKRAAHLQQKDFKQALTELQARGPLVIPGDGDN